MDDSRPIKHLNSVLTQTSTQQLSTQRPSSSPSYSGFSFILTSQHPNHQAHCIYIFSPSHHIITTYYLVLLPTKTTISHSLLPNHNIHHQINQGGNLYYHHHHHTQIYTRLSPSKRHQKKVETHSLACLLSALVFLLSSLQAFIRVHTNDSFFSR
jgi:hypothetical protein